MENYISNYIETLLKNFNPINYYTFWALVWYILYKMKTIKISPLIIFIIIFIPSTYILIIYIKYSNDILLIYIFKILISSVVHYIPLIELLIKLDIKSSIKLSNIFSLEAILLNLVLVNLYFTYLNYNYLDVNKLYEHIYFTK